MVNPKTFISSTAPMSEIGMAMTGMITPRTDPRKRKMMMMTMSSVSASVFSTSSIASWM